MNAISIIGVVISVISLIVAAVVGFSNLRRSTGTENAVKAVQKKLGYKPTGEVGPKFVKMVMK